MLTSMLTLQRYLIFLLISAITLPQLTSGLKCKCTDDCPEESTCETTAGGACYAQYYSDVSGKHWNLRKGCLDDLSSVICQYTNSDTHTNVCCNDTDYCNDNLITSTLPPVVSCICKGKNCQDDDLCTLDPSTNQSCYIIFEKLGSIITRRQGCSTKCKEYHRDNKIRKCCQEDKCNNEAIPTVWPSPPSAVVTATPAPPTTDSVSSDILTSEQPTTLGPRRPTELKCHCSDCRNGMDTCLATVACASRVVETVKMTWCIADEFTCKNNSFQLDCCYEDYCNGPSRPIPGPPCDDEDTESSGGCDFGSVTSSTTLSSPITTTSTSTVSSEATPTSTNKATPTESITKDTDTETQYDNSEMMMVFYFFTILLSVCIITMIIVVVACVVMVCHYRGMAYKTVLSSSTILESAMKEKGFPITNSSTV